MAPSNRSDDLRHFLADDGAVPPPIARRLDHLTDLCRFATSGPSGAPRQTAVRCRARPGRKPCPGLLVVRLRDVPSQVDWKCAECAAEGRITGWEETDADLRDLLPATETGFRLAISAEEHEALRSAARTDPTFIAVAFQAEVDAQGRVWLTGPRRWIDDYFTKLLSFAAAVEGSHIARRLLAVALHLRDAGRTGRAHADQPSATIRGNQAMAALVSLLGLADAKPVEFVPHRKRPQPRSLREAAATAGTYRIKVSLRHIQPPIWRRLHVPADILLPDLHRVLQAAMGWSDAHLHMFSAGKRNFVPPHTELERAEDSSTVTLAELAPHKGARVRYEYDFGDGWEHDVLVEEILAEPCDAPRCLKGRGACPPEDCGGPSGYGKLLSILADPSDAEHEDMLSWLGGPIDPEHFDVMATDARVRAVAVRDRARR